MKISVSSLTAAVSVALLTACGGGGGGGSSTPAPAGPTTAEIAKATSLAGIYKAAMLLNSTENTPLFTHTTNDPVCVNAGASITISPQGGATAPYGVDDTIRATLANCNDSFATLNSVQELTFQTANGGSDETVGTTRTTSNEFVGLVNYGDDATSAVVGANTTLLGGEGYIELDSLDVRVTEAETLEVDSLYTLQFCSSLTTGNACSNGADKELNLSINGADYTISEFSYTIVRDIDLEFDTTTTPDTVTAQDAYDYTITAEGKLLDVAANQTVTFNTTSDITGTISEPPLAGVALLDDGTGEFSVTFAAGTVTVRDTADNQLILETTWDDI